MTVRKYSWLQLIVVASVYLFQVTVEAQNSCNCKCMGISLKKNTVCPIFQQLRKKLENLFLILGNRTEYINRLTGMEKKWNLHDELIHKIRPRPSNVRSAPKRDKLKKTRRDIRGLENMIHNVTDFIERLDVEDVVHAKFETMKESLLKNDISALQSKLDGVEYKNDTKILNERLNSLETKLSNLTELISQMSMKIKSFRTDLERMNQIISESIQSEEDQHSLLDVLSIKIIDLENLKEQVEILNHTISVYQYGLSEIQNNIKGFEKKTKKKEKILVNLVLQSSLNGKQMTTDQLEKFRTEWILNCSRGLMPCFLLESAKTNPMLNRTLNQKFDQQPSGQYYRRMQGEISYGCAPILPKNYPNLQITRNDNDKTVTFSCAMNATLIGTTYTHCRQGKWIPDTPPICV